MENNNQTIQLTGRNELERCLKQINKASNFTDCLTSQLPVISSTLYDVNELRQFIIQHTCDFLLIHSPDWNDAQVTLIAKTFASDMIETRLDWRLEDVIYFFKFFRQRKDLEACQIFGNRITIDKLNEAMYAYELERADARVAMNKNKHIEPNEPLSISPETKQLIAGIKNRLTPEIKYSPPREKTESEKVIQELMNHFDDVFKSCGEIIGGVKFVNYEGKKLNLEQFCNLFLDV